MLTSRQEPLRTVPAALLVLLLILLLGLQAGCATYPAATSELDRLQGRWEGEGASGDKIAITITGDSLHYYARDDFWYDTTITLPAATDPAQLFATIRDSAPPVKDVGVVVTAIFKIEDGTLTLATNDGSGSPPASFADALSSYLLKRAQP